MCGALVAIENADCHGKRICLSTFPSTSTWAHTVTLLYDLSKAHSRPVMSYIYFITHVIRTASGSHHPPNKSNKHAAQKSCDCRRTFGSPKDRISPIYTSITTISTHWPRLPENGIARKGLCASRGRGYRQAGGDVHGTQPLRSVPGWVGH